MNWTKLFNERDRHLIFDMGVLFLYVLVEGAKEIWCWIVHPNMIPIPDSGVARCPKCDRRSLCR